MNKAPERFFEAQLKGEDPPALETMRTLCDLALEILGRRPWSVLGDGDLVLVEGALPGETCFCSIMGALGQVLSLHAYLGTDGYRLLKKLQSGKPIAIGEFFAEARCLYVEFVRLGELTPPDRALLKSLGHSLKRGVRAPIFRSIRPGYHPWYVTESEAHVLMKCERAFLAFWDVFALNAEQDFWEQEDFYPLVVPSTENQKEGGFQIHQVRVPVPARAMQEPPALDEAGVKRVRESGFPPQGAWEVDRFHGAGMIGERNERKACFRTAIAINAESGFAYSPVVVSPDTSDGEALNRAIFQAIEGAHAMPAEIHVRSNEFRALLEPLARALVLSIKVKKSLPALDFAKSELLKMMGDPGPFSACGPEESE